MLWLHRQQIAEHGGFSGIKDEGLLDAALARPQHLFHYERPDLYRLAAAYAFGLAKGHAFNDGNKRVSFVVTLLFLRENGRLVHFVPRQGIDLWIGLAAGTVSELEMAVHLRSA